VTRLKKYPKLVQCDKRGQIVIPKDIRQALNIDEGAGFWVYAIEDEGILLKKISRDELTENSTLMKQLKEKSDSTGIKIKKLDSTIKTYKKRKDGNLDVI